MGGISVLANQLRGGDGRRLAQAAGDRAAGWLTAAGRLIEPHAGYPAGLPRLTTLDLTGKLCGDRCVLRIKTNMECYYDQAFIAVRDRSAEKSLRVKSLPVARAVLGYRGYTREISPDGEQPSIYDYDHVDPAPLARLSGKLTRFGDVARAASEG